MENPFLKEYSAKTAMLLVITIFLVSSYFIIAWSWQDVYGPSVPFSRIKIPKILGPTAPFDPIEDIKQFTSEKDFKDYLEKSRSFSDHYWGRGGGGGFEEIPVASPAPVAKQDIIPSRVSETTVQVVGIDEPDIIKTDGEKIYFSKERHWGWRDGCLGLEGYKCIPSREGETDIINAFPPQDLLKDSKINFGGKLLLSGKTLVIFEDKDIFGYDISDPKNPKEKWNLGLGAKSRIFQSRLYKDKIYLVTREHIDTLRPCPIKPMVYEGGEVVIKCEDIYHPVAPVPVDEVYAAMVISAASGKIEKTVSFVGSWESVVYMSEKALYITYSQSQNLLKFSLNFLGGKCRDIVPNWLILKLEKLDSYDISESAKLTEFEILWSKFLGSLDQDAVLKLENDLANRMLDYYKEHKRELESTGIVKIILDSFKIENTGKVPGRPLNQFSLDEHNGNLRIATNIGDNISWGWRFGLRSQREESANDVYVLDKNLNLSGSIKDLGMGERIYSVRFIEDKGYVVTFRQIDPFYVLDLSNPSNPQKKGELKIPGYSSYLHPIAKDKILGIGQEDWRVKISLFDVANPNDPRELDKYILDEGWSEVLNTHHAFLLDSKHEIFFLPGGKGGYIFSYKNNKLGLVRAVSGISVRRAIYIDDYLYLVGDEKITVLSQLNWEKVKELKL